MPKQKTWNREDYDNLPISKIEKWSSNIRKKIIEISQEYNIPSEHYARCQCSSYEYARNFLNPDYKANVSIVNFFLWVDACQRGTLLYGKDKKPILADEILCLKEIKNILKFKIPKHSIL